MENMKFLQARDGILAYLLAKDFNVGEIKQVLKMCNNELDAWERRSKLVEERKEEE